MSGHSCCCGTPVGPGPCGCCLPPCAQLPINDPKACGGLAAPAVLCEEPTVCDELDGPLVWVDTVLVHLSVNIQSYIHFNRDGSADCNGDGIEEEWKETLYIKGGITFDSLSIPTGGSFFNDCTVASATAKFAGTITRTPIKPTPGPDEVEDIEATVSFVVDLTTGEMAITATDYPIHGVLTPVAASRDVCNNTEVIDGIGVAAGDLPPRLSCLPIDAPGGGPNNEQLGQTQWSFTKCHAAGLFRAQNPGGVLPGGNGQVPIICFPIDAGGCAQHQWLHVEVAGIFVAFAELTLGGFCTLFDDCGGLGYFWPETFEDISIADPPPVSNFPEPCESVICVSPCRCSGGVCYRPVVLSATCGIFFFNIPCATFGGEEEIDIDGTTFCIKPDPAFPGSQINYILCDPLSSDAFCDAVVEPDLGGG